LEKIVWIDTSKHPKADMRKRLILTALKSGFGHIVVSPEDKQSNKYGRFHMIISEADRFLLDGAEIARAIRISTKEEEKRAIELAKGSEKVVIEASDWRIIPLENLIVHFSKEKAELFVRAETVEDAKLFLETMERGADGIIFVPSSAEEIGKIAKLITQQLPKQQLVEATIKTVKQLGLGDRVCVDTCSILRIGEGMLVGSSSSGLFLIHSETYESEYVASRPFRVNAGAVHAYTLQPDGNTKYLCELQSGDEVLIVDSEGNPRAAIVGRVKIERRPLLLIEAEVDDITYSTIVQNAETIRLVSRDKAISVTELMPDDLVSLRTEAGGRHFGSAVDETIQEK